MGRRLRFTRNLGRAELEKVPRRGAGARYVRFAHRTRPFGVCSFVDDARPRLSEPDRVEL